ncbi:MAG: LysR family transcriptional regulator [Acetobacteraceae bacterium]|jgi:DNA-binding transcriptional LysR family regulator
MNVQDLRYLSVAADVPILARAAEALGLHASTIGRCITRLEDELQTQLSPAAPHLVAASDHFVT